MIAMYNGKACAHCAGSILAGQKISGEKGAYHHVDCSDLTVYPQPNRNGNGNGGAKIENPNAPMSPAQVSFIGELLSERTVTMGEASVIIDHLKSRPKRQLSESEVLADDLRNATI